MTFYLSTYPRHLTRRWDVRSNDAQEAPHALPVDVREEDDAYLLTAFVPGLTAEQLNIQILDDTLSIEGEYPQDESEYVLSELPSGAFRRTLRLASELDAEKAEAKIDNGVLTLRLPKAESARPKVIKVAAN
jgi:HSP20 family protein